MKKTILVLAAFFTAAVLCACTDDSGDASESHLLEAQQQALERARQVEGDIADAAERRAEALESSDSDG